MTDTKSPTPAPTAAPPVIVEIERRNGMWHTNCENHLGGVMREVSQEPDRSLMKCLSCGKQGYYPVGGVGLICAEEVPSAVSAQQTDVVKLVTDAAERTTKRLAEQSAQPVGNMSIEFPPASSTTSGDELAVILNRCYDREDSLLVTAEKLRKLFATATSTKGATAEGAEEVRQYRLLPSQQVWADVSEQDYAHAASRGDEVRTLYATAPAPQAAPEAPASEQQAQLVVGTSVTGSAVCVVVHLKRADQTVAVYSRNHVLNGESLGVAMLPSDLFASPAATTASAIIPHELAYQSGDGEVSTAYVNGWNDCRDTMMGCIPDDPTNRPATTASASARALDWYDQEQAENGINRDSFHLFVLKLIEELRTPAPGHDAAPQAPSQIKTWQERCDWKSDQPATKLMVEAMKAQIADLRAALAAQPTKQQAITQVLAELEALTPNELRAELEKHKGKLRLEVPSADLAAGGESIDDTINGPLTDAQRSQARELYAQMHHFGPCEGDGVIRAISVMGYVNGVRDTKDDGLAGSIAGAAQTWPSFEAWLASDIVPPANATEYARQAFEAGQAAPVGEAVRNGWKLVPPEPTHEMREAFAAGQYSFKHEGEDHPGMLYQFRHQYACMLAVAPSHASEPAGEGSTT